jgi:nucleotide-binding universal stress UspA family protein
VVRPQQVKQEGTRVEPKSSVVVGVDGTETASQAAHVAAELATAFGADLHLVSAYGKLETEQYSVAGEQLVLSTEKDAQVILEREATRLRQAFPSITIETDPMEGKPGPALVRTAERLDAKVIVVGNKRVQGIARVFGSIATEVARQAPCDVYIAHTHRGSSAQ